MAKISRAISLPKKRRDIGDRGKIHPSLAFLFGSTDIGTFQLGSAFSTAYTFTPDGDGIIESASFYGRTGGVAGNALIAGIYDTSAGKPTNLVGRTTNAQAVTTIDSWQSVTFETPVPITSGTQYWVVFDDALGAIIYLYRIDTVGGQIYTTNFNNTYPSPLTTYSTFPWEISVYVEGTYT